MLRAEGDPTEMLPRNDLGAENLSRANWGVLFVRSDSVRGNTTSLQGPLYEPQGETHRGTPSSNWGAGAIRGRSGSAGGLVVVYVIIIIISSSSSSSNIIIIIIIIITIMIHVIIIIIIIIIMIMTLIIIIIMFIITTAMRVPRGPPTASVIIWTCCAVRAWASLEESHSMV